VLRVILGMSAALLLTGCGKPLGPIECDSLFDHYTELLLRSDRPDANPRQQADLRAQALQAAHLDPHFLACSSQVSRREFDCAMRSQDVDSFERCLM
jgi:hypothetical protein